MTTPNFAIPELAAAQAQKYVTVNEALRTVDAAMNLVVIRADFTAPPGSPSEGDKYIPFATASGAWTGQEDNVALFINGTWVFFVPVEGWRAYNQTTNELLVFDGTSWAAFKPSFGNGTAAAPAYSFASDPDTGMYRNAANQLGFATGGAERFLLTNTQATVSTGDLIVNNAGTNAVVTVNKGATGNDAGFTFQTAFSTVAQLGALGDDQFTIKVGGSFTTALTIDSATAAVDLPQHSKFLAYLNFGQNYTAGAWRNLGQNITVHNDQADLVITSNVGTFTAPHDGYFLFGCSATFEAGAGNPTAMRLGFSVNGAAPADYTTVATGDSAFVTLETAAISSTVLKLTAGDTVNASIFFTTNNGRVAADRNSFWGAQIA